MTWEILVINMRFVYSIIWFIWKIGVIANDYWKTIIYGFFQKITLIHMILYIFAWTVIVTPVIMKSCITQKSKGRHEKFSPVLSHDDEFFHLPKKISLEYTPWERFSDFFSKFIKDTIPFKILEQPHFKRWLSQREDAPPAWARACWRSVFY